MIGYLSKSFLHFTIELSDHLAPLALILWGMSRISLIKFTFLLLGLFGILISKEIFIKHLAKISLILSTFYLIVQTFYNFSFVDVFLKSMGTKLDKQLFFIGFYKYYNLFHGHLLKFNYDYDEIKVKRKNGIVWDNFVFCIYFVIYILLMKKQ